MPERIKIMAAVDLSEYSSVITRYCLWLARRLDGDLVMVNVINQRDLYMVQRVMVGYDTFSYPDYLDQQEQARLRKMKSLFGSADTDDIACECLVRAGIPYRELLAAIESEKPHLIVVGTKGRGNLADVLVGSTARKIYRQSPIPLLTLPAGFDGLPD
jgi:nucleotide-binding universal stress UspA family protein